MTSNLSSTRKKTMYGGTGRDRTGSFFDGGCDATMFRCGNFWSRSIASMISETNLAAFAWELISM
jgi:hypothetical protein